MVKKFTEIISAKNRGTFEEMYRSILSQAGNAQILKITFFFSPENDKEYISHNNLLRSAVKEYFPHSTPLVSYVAQKTASGSLVAEFLYTSDSNAVVERHPRYILLKKGYSTELITEGIIPQNISASTFEQSSEIFATIGTILQSNGFAPSDIYRQWNYIQGITVLNDGSQNYQEFNDARSIFYSNSNWSNGYPAATGIGTAIGGVMVELFAIKGEDVANSPLDNPLQTAAHNYSQRVLDGKAIKELNERTTPKFERARILGNSIYISGTAAIRGEDSNSSRSTVEQTAETMKIMDCLVSKENIPVESCGSRYTLLRVYVKREEEIPQVKEYIQEHYPSVPAHFLVADICRPELLVEIEGTGEIKE